jgi:hypothetical protein
MFGTLRVRHTKRARTTAFFSKDGHSAVIGFTKAVCFLADVHAFKFMVVQQMIAAVFELVDSIEFNVAEWAHPGLPAGLPAVGLLLGSSLSWDRSSVRFRLCLSRRIDQHFHFTAVGPGRRFPRAKCLDSRVIQLKMLHQVIPHDCRPCLRRETFPTLRCRSLRR